MPRRRELPRPMRRQRPVGPGAEEATAAPPHRKTADRDGRAARQHQPVRLGAVHVVPPPLLLGVRGPGVPCAAAGRRRDRRPPRPPPSHHTERGRRRVW
ncbi:hypothetical protein NKH77_20670 [Streptomyces sp. M19]